MPCLSQNRVFKKEKKNILDKIIKEVYIITLFNFPISVMRILNKRIRTIGLVGIALTGVAVMNAVTAENAAEHADAQIPIPECRDNFDNDNDGFIDFPEDENCDSLNDNFEGLIGNGVFLTVTDEKERIEAGKNLNYIIVLSTNVPEPQLTDVRFRLPAQTAFVNASDNGRIMGQLVLWDNVMVFPEQSKILSANIHVNPYAEEGEVLVAEAVVGGNSATDVTTVYKETIPASNALSISVTDGQEYAEKEEVLTYRILVTNKEYSPQTIDLRSQISQHFIVHEVSGPHNKDGRQIEWSNLHFEPKETREFFVTGHIERDTPSEFTLKFNVSSGKELAVDHTTVGLRDFITKTLNVSINDGYQLARNGDVLTYEVYMENATDVLVTNLDVNASVPGFSEFVSADAGGQWDGSGVHWTDLTIAPFGSRILTFAVRIRSDAPLGTSLRAGVLANGNEAYDITDVGSYVIGASSVAANTPMLSKVADRSEVRPGDSVGYTVILRNTTNTPFTNVYIEDRFDGRVMRVTEATSGNIDVGSITWNVPVIAPGEAWTATYRVQIHPKAPHGVQLNNVVSAKGEGMESLSLTERVFTSQVGVITQLPKSGVAMDSIFLLITSLMGIAPVGMQLKRKLVLA